MSGSRPSFSELDDNARNGIRACVEAAEKCLQGSARELKAVTPSALDALWVDLRADLRSRNAQDAEIKSVINMIGLAFGELLVQQLGMQ